MRAADESSLPRLLRASLWGLPVAARVVVAPRCERAARVWLWWRCWRVIVEASQRLQPAQMDLGDEVWTKSTRSLAEEKNSGTFMTFIQG